MYRLEDNDPILGLISKHKHDSYITVQFPEHLYFNMDCTVSTSSITFYANLYFIFIILHSYVCGSSSSVGIATDYGLDGPGSKTCGDEIFRPSRPALGPTQPPVKWVPSVSRG